MKKQIVFKEWDDFMIINNVPFSSGNYGKVYHCRKKNECFDNYVVKIIPKNDENPKVINDEIRANDCIVKINSPYILKSERIYTDENAVYIISKYCNMGTLEEYINHKQILEFTEVRNIFIQIASCVKEMHSFKLVHRDLKPQNVFLNQNEKGELKCLVADFGFSKESQVGKMNSTLCGTPITMSPDIVNKYFTDEKVDIWALGIILYKLCFGKYPFDGADPLPQIVEGKYKLPVIYTISIELIELLENCIWENYIQRLTAEQVMNSNFVKVSPEYQHIIVLNKEITLSSKSKEFKKHYTENAMNGTIERIGFE